MKPISLRTEGLNVLIIGFGCVGKRKATAYNQAGANVTTVDFSAEKRADYQMAYTQYFEAHKTHFLKQHLIIIATSDEAINTQIESDCKVHYKLYNRADNGTGFFSDMTYHISEDYMVAASGLGKAPSVSKFILEKIQMHLQAYTDEISKMVYEAAKKRKRN